VRGGKILPQSRKGREGAQRKRGVYAESTCGLKERRNSSDVFSFGREVKRRDAKVAE